MHSACDIEGHKSDEDQRYYLLDFSRSFPPESPYKVPSPRKNLVNVSSIKYIQAREQAVPAGTVVFGSRYPFLHRPELQAQNPQSV